MYTLQQPKIKTIETVHNTGLRLCTGAFTTSPVDSLKVDSGSLPLHLRRQQQLLSYATRILAAENNSIYPYLFDNIKFNSLKNRKINYQPFYKLARLALQNTNIEINKNYAKGIRMVQL